MHHVMPQLYHDVVGEIERATRGYLETSIAILERDYTDTDKAGMVRGQPIKNYLRRIAKDMKRPFVYAEVLSWHPWTNGKRDKSQTEWGGSLRLPSHNRFKPMLAALLLVAEPYGNHGPVVHRPGQTYNHFNFSGDGGRIVLEGFIEQCRADPVFRVCLRAV
jgi:hypothetical protein